MHGTMCLKKKNYIRNISETVSVSDITTDTVGLVKLNLNSRSTADIRLQEEVADDWRKFCKEELQDVYSSPYIFGPSNR